MEVGAAIVSPILKTEVRPVKSGPKA